MPSPGGPSGFVFTKIQAAVFLVAFPAVALYCWAESRWREWNFARKNG